MSRLSAPRAWPARVLSLTAAAVLAASAGLASAALPNGSKAPEFQVDAAIGGKAFKFTLAEQLKKGPVVLYFYPKAFTSGCTVEAHQFAEATPQFEALGATVIGMSNDDIDTLKKFSIEACRNKFAVAADPEAKIAKQYDAKIKMMEMADRVSFVLSPEGKVIFSHTAMSPAGHITETLKAVQAWKAQQTAPAKP